MSRQSDLHVLDFFLDDEDSCALTVYSDKEDVRFHIIADVDKLESSTKSLGQHVYKQYLDLVAAVRNGGNTQGKTSGSEHDSGVDMSSPVAESDEPASKPLTSTEDAEDALHAWMLAPLEEQRADSEHDRQQPTVQEYYDSATRYFELEISKSGDLAAVELEATADLKQRMAKLKPEATLPKYIRELGLPWYPASDLEILGGSSAPPPYHPTQVRLRSTGETFFFKCAASDAPQVTKREINLLHRISKPDLCDKIRAPRLKALVGSGTSSTKALGFLQSEIPNPVPLTMKIDAEVPQELRDRWADEADRMKEALHEQNIIWGDAKADNFLVDSADNLWMIDMGGSYTEGWIDPELQETEEGDDMGVEKIVNALHDPVANTIDPEDDGVKPQPSDSGRDGSEDEEAEQEQEEGDVAEQETPHRPARGQKRKAEDEPHTETYVQVTPRKHKSAKQVTEELLSRPTDDRSRAGTPMPEREDREKLYCYCRMPSQGRMVACDGESCRLEWIHFACAGIEEEPREDEKWYCDECKE